MAVAQTERFTDQHGNPWEIQTVLLDGGARLIVTDPNGEDHELIRVCRSHEPRISVDAETPLPLENL